MLKIVNQTVPPALEKLGYNAEEIERIIAHIDAVRHDRRRDRDEPDAVEHRFRQRPEARASAGFRLRLQAVQRQAQSLHYMGHLRMMAAAQPFLSGAISKTVNMPEDGHGRGNHEHLHRRLAARAEGDRDLPRRLEALRAVEHAQDQRHGRRRIEAARCDRSRAARSTHRRTRQGNRRNCAARSISRSAIACPTRACR